MIWEVLRPQHPGETSSITDPGIAIPARFTPNPWAPGELNERAAGELYIRCLPETSSSGMFLEPRLESSPAVIENGAWLIFYLPFLCHCIMEALFH